MEKSKNKLADVRKPLPKVKALKNSNHMHLIAGGAGTPIGTQTAAGTQTNNGVGSYGSYGSYTSAQQ